VASFFGTPCIVSTISFVALCSLHVPKIIQFLWIHPLEVHVKLSILSYCMAKMYKVVSPLATSVYAPARLDSAGWGNAWQGIYRVQQN